MAKRLFNQMTMKSKKKNSIKVKHKFYTVFKGWTPGVYDNWADAYNAHAGFRNPYFRKFDTLKKAKDALLKYRFWKGKQEKLRMNKVNASIQQMISSL
jgi:viroplasmin and RNaseH domain-containing protein